MKINEDKKILREYETIINKIIECCVKIENGYADGLYPEEMKMVATHILDIINKKNTKKYEIF